MREGKGKEGEKGMKENLGVVWREKGTRGELWRCFLTPFPLILLNINEDPLGGNNK